MQLNIKQLKELNPKPKIILVLGMHRSGTSLVAQLIAKWGVFMGNDLMKANDYNEDGYWEYNPLVEFHEKLLKKTNNSTYGPSEEINVNELIKKFGDEARQLVKEMDISGDIWCWKDPRMPLFLDFWMKILVNREIIYILTYRQPQDIAASLFARDKLPFEVSLSLWEFTTSKIFETIHSELNYKFINYNKLISNPESICRDIFDYLNNLCRINKSLETYESMFRSVKRSLNHSPGLILSLSPNHKKLKQFFEQGIIPNDFRITENQLYLLKVIFALFGKTAPQTKHLYFAQLYLKNENDIFDEKHSLIKEILGNTQLLSFKFDNSLIVKNLRFDPLNDYLSVRLISVQLLLEGKILNIPFILSSNALTVENEIYLFNTLDPQIYIDFEYDMSHEIDEVIVKLEYLTIGNKTLEPILDLKESVIKTQRNEFNKQLNNFIAILLNESKEDIPNFEFIKDNNSLSNQIEKATELLHSLINKHHNEQLKLTSEIEHLEADNVLLMQHIQNVTSNNIEQEKKMIKLVNNQIMLEEQNKNLSKDYKTLENKLIESENLITKVSQQLKQTKLELNNLQRIPGIIYIHRFMFTIMRYLPINYLKVKFNKWGINRDYILLKYSRYFNEAYYLNRNPDIKSAGVSPIKHYLRHGGFEGRNPSDKFDSYNYLYQNPDVKASGMNPLIHYLKFGKVEGRIIRANDNNTSNCNNTETYSNWVKKFDTLCAEDFDRMGERLTTFHKKPLISVIMPVYNSNPKFLSEAIDSVISQVYPYWELCIADDNSSNPEIKKIIRKFKDQDSRIKILFRESNGHISNASNSALELATGEYIALLDHDDLIPAHALFMIVETLNKYPNAKLIYSDEDKINDSKERSNPYFKCDWNRELFYSQNMISHLGVYDTKIVKKIGGFRVGFEGSQDYDLALRFIENIVSEEIIHIPKILYHWRMHNDSVALNINSKNYAYEAAMNALKEHFQRKNIEATVISITSGLYRIRYALPKDSPLVSIIIPTKNKFELLKKCIDSILNSTTYKNFEIIIIDNQSDEIESIEYLNELVEVKQAKCIKYKQPFNFSKLVNYGVSQSNGEFVCLMNNDIEVISPDWLEEMLSIAKLKDVGAVGAKLLYPNNTIQHGGVILGIGGIASHAHKFLPANHFGYFGRAAVAQQFSAVTAACLLMKKSVYLEIGGFNENDLSVAFNDVDFCLRLVNSGYRNIFTPFAEFYHHESASRGYDTSPEKNVRFQKEIEYMQKYWGHILQNDPAYNPNLTLHAEDFGLAWPPRHSTITAQINMET